VKLTGLWIEATVVVEAYIGILLAEDVPDTVEYRVLLEDLQGLIERAPIRGALVLAMLPV
jgi:hypothetical protein